jgi:hypothetical protein
MEHPLSTEGDTLPSRGAPTNGAGRATRQLVLGKFSPRDERTPVRTPDSAAVRRYRPKALPKAGRAEPIAATQRALDRAASIVGGTLILPNGERLGLTTAKPDKTQPY